jgi:hypothetical protein
MDKKSPKKFSTMFGWWVGLDALGKIKCAVLCWLKRGETALLILRSVGILSFFFCSFIVSRASFRVSANVLQLPEGGDYEVPHVRDQPSTNFDTKHKASFNH